MMILTAKVDFKKIILILAAAAAVLLALILIFGPDQSKTTAAPAAPVTANDSRVKFLQDFGWEVVPNPAESTQVRIPQETGEVFRRYNTLQKGQGYDLSKYAGKKVMRYVYTLKNYPGATEPVYATLLVYKNKVIGGDVTDTSPNGKIRGFQMPAPAQPTSPAQPAPAEPAQP